MNQAPSTHGAIPITIAAAAVVIASFLPWGMVSGTPGLPFGGLGGLQISLALTAWNGTISPLGLALPNWLVVVAAVAVAAMAWLEASAAWKAPAALPLALAAYGFLHVSFLMVALGTSGRATVGIGSLLTALAFAGMAYALVRQRRAVPGKFGLPVGE